MELETDTTPQARAVLTDKLRSMTAAEKLDLALAMSRTVRDLAVAGIRQRHPQASPREVLLRLAVVQHGRSLAMAAYPEIADLDGP